MTVFIWIIILVVYFLPTVWAYSKAKKNKEAILLLNLLAGWTVLGWLAALIWAATVDK